MGRKPTPFVELFVKKINYSDNCWDWLAAKDKDGYGLFQNKRAHRVSFEMFIGKIPKNYVIDHLCRNRKCVNPTHLRAVTYQINTIENSNSIQAKNAAKTHCKNGHEFTTKNTMIHTRGKGRKCRTCHSHHVAKRQSATSKDSPTGKAKTV